jgi:multidrug efflux system outer membrane protein
MSKFSKGIMLSICSIFLLASCSGKIGIAQSPLDSMTPANWSEWQPINGNQYISWSSLNDIFLTELISQGLETSLDIESANQRLLSAQISFEASSATRIPFVYFSMSERRFGQLDGNGNRAYSSSLSASYEVDLWGRREKSIQSSELSVKDAQVAMQSARISLAAGIADSYFNIRALDKKIILQQKSLAAAEKTRTLVEARLKAGLVIRTDLDRQDVQIAGLQTNIESLRSNRVQFVNALASILGKLPGEFKLAVSGAPLNLPANLSPYTPAEILRNRPDIKSQEILLAKSSINVELVRTDLYPTFALSASADSGSVHLDDLFSSALLPWSQITQATLPLLDGKARETQVKLAALGHEQVITGYKRTLLSALRDVETALARQDSIRRQRESLDRQKESQKRVSRDTQEKYKAGKASAFDLLSDSNQLIIVEQQEVDIWLSSATSTVSLLRAFGVDPLAEES